MSTTETDCLFCRIAAGEIPATVVARTDRVLAFRDISPAAPTHVLVIPVEHQPNLAATAAADATVVGEMVLVAADIAAAEGVGDDYRLVTNTGAGAGQSVFHTHLHVLGGRDLTWPPG